jgi:DMSO/TMAO reductase YedYZ molybdopterin-dependent catalytic subunit
MTNGTFSTIRIRGIARRDFIRLTGASILALYIPGCSNEGTPSDITIIPSQNLQEISPISENDDFYVVEYFGMVDVDPETWACTIKIRGDEIAVFDYDFLTGLDGREKEHTLQCIESSPSVERMNNAVWFGLPLKEIFDAVDVPMEDLPPFMKISCADGYMTGLASTDIDRPTWLVWRMNGETLPKKNGFPARLLIPGLLGWKNAKQVTEFNFVDEHYVAPWEGSLHRGNLIPWETEYGIQSLIVQPTDLSIVESGSTVRILGKAFAGSEVFEWIRVSTDGGETFTDAEITYQKGPDVWTLWAFDWIPEGPGSYIITVACRTETGKETESDPHPTKLPWNGGMTLEIEVA